MKDDFQKGQNETKNCKLKWTKGLSMHGFV